MHLRCYRHLEYWLFWFIIARKNSLELARISIANKIEETRKFNYCNNMLKLCFQDN